jgi:hypothetical protein
VKKVTGKKEAGEDYKPTLMGSSGVFFECCE